VQLVGVPFGGGSRVAFHVLELEFLVLVPVLLARVRLFEVVQGGDLAFGAGARQAQALGVAQRLRARAVELAVVRDPLERLIQLVVLVFNRLRVLLERLDVLREKLFEVFVLVVLVLFGLRVCMGLVVVMFVVCFANSLVFVRRV